MAQRCVAERKYFFNIQSRFIRLAFSAVLLALVFFLPGTARALTSAGINIINIALGSYEGPDGQTWQVSSNVVMTTVKQVYGIEIKPDGTMQDPGQIITATPGQFLQIPYTLRNSGNGADTCNLSAANLSSTALIGAKIYIDSNQNGVFDQGEPLYSNQSPPQLSAGQVLSLIVMGEVPSTVSSGSIYINLSGYSNGDNTALDKDNVARIDIVQDGAVTATETPQNTDAAPGSVVSLSVIFQNAGTNPLKPADITDCDFNNTGTANTEKGLLVSNTLPPYTSYEAGTASGTVNSGFPVFASQGGPWKKDSLQAGNVAKIGYFIPPNAAGNTLEVGQRGTLNFKLAIDGNAPAQQLTNYANVYYANNSGPQTAQTNVVNINIKPTAKIELSDTDGNNDDLMVIDSATSGYTEKFLNEAWNLGNGADTVNIIFDPSTSSNIPPGMTVSFYKTDGTPLQDTDGDGLVDSGPLAPGQGLQFYTVVYAPPDINAQNVRIALKGISHVDPAQTDYTYDLIQEIKNAAVETEITTQTQAGMQTEALGQEKVVVYEYDSSGNLASSKVFMDDANGLVIYDENGNPYPLYNYLKTGMSYRLTLPGDYQNYSWYLSPTFYKSDFDTVKNPGDTYTRGGITVDMQQNGTILLKTAIAPAGYLYDSATGAKVNGACVYLHRCQDSTCQSDTLVDASVLDFYPDGKTPQADPQISGPMGTDGKGAGAFEYLFRDPEAAAGWYFVEADFSCSLPGVNSALSQKYAPVRAKRDSVWDPNSQGPYNGGKFQISPSFPGAILMHIPLAANGVLPLQVQKTVDKATASVGEMLKFTIKITNPNSTETVYDISGMDKLPRELRYKKGTAVLNGNVRLEPAVTPDGTLLDWGVGSLGPGQTAEIDFSAYVGAGATEGKKTNEAEALGWTAGHAAQVGSNQAFASFAITEGVFTDKGYIIGKVYIDTNMDGVQDFGEPGVRGVRIYMEDGRYVITDSEGKFHMDDVDPGTHVLKLDPTTLPPGLKLAATGNRNMGDPGSVFADLFSGDIFKADFRAVKTKSGVQTGHEGTEGMVSATRSLGTPQIDPSTGKITLRHVVRIKNISGKPVFEARYIEKSPYSPIEGTSYMDGSPIGDPKKGADGHTWSIPIIEPGEEAVITFNSALPEEKTPASARFAFRVEPSGQDLEKDVLIPVIFTGKSDGEYDIAVAFQGGNLDVPKGSLKSLDGVIELLRKKDYKDISVSAVEQAQAGQGGKPDAYSPGLDRQRADAVKAYLGASFIDMRKVKVNESGPGGMAWHGTGLPGKDGSMAEVKLFGPGPDGKPHEVQPDGLKPNGMYRLEFRMESSLYPAEDLHGLKIYIALPKGLAYVTNTALLNGARTEPSKAGEFYVLSSAGIDRRKPLELAMSVFASGPLGSGIPVIVYCRNKNGGVLNLASSAPDELVEKSFGLYSPAVQSPAATKEKREPAPDEKVKYSILYPAADITQSARRTDIKIAVPEGSSWSVLLNGKPVPAGNIAETAVDDKLKAKTVSFVGVPLKEGANTLSLSINGHEACSRTITVTGEAADMRYSVYPSKPQADGKTPVYVVVRFLDENGALVKENDYLKAYVDKQDIFDYATGQYKRALDDSFKVKITGGKAVIKLSPSAVTETRKLTLKYGDMQKEIFVSFYPERRPWVVAGSLDAGVGLVDKKNNPEGLDKMPFDNAHSTEANGGVFAKGSISDYTLTMRYSLNKEDDNTLLKQNIPSTEENQFYPVYGDSSEQVFETQSQKRLYLKLERNLSYFLYGDYNTNFGNLLEYNTYQRTLNGGMVNLEKNKNYMVKSFVSRNNQSVVREELPGKGISGPYLLKSNQIIEFSEKVWIEVRDRYNPNVILSRKEMNRFTDYTINYDEGWILFSSPVQGYDDAFNPVLIEVIYETANQPKDNYVYGARAEKFFLDGKLRAGASAVREESAIKNKDLYGADVIYDGKNLKGAAEIAKSANFAGDDLTPTSGTAERAEVSYKKDAGEFKAYYKRVSAGFQNPSSTNADSGYESYEATGAVALDRKTRLLTDILFDNRAGANDKKVETLAERKLSEKLLITGGLRWVQAGANSTSADNVQAVLGAVYKPTQKLSFNLRREQVLEGTNNVDLYPTRTIGSANYAISKNLASYLQTEVDETDQKDVSLTTLGVDSKLGENTTAFSKYTLDDAVSGWRNQSHIGLNHTFLAIKGLNLDGGVENVRTLKGDGSQDYTAMHIAAAYLRQENYKLTGRCEVRLSPSETDQLFTTGGSLKLSKDYSLLATERYFKTNQTEDDLAVGLAYRPVDNDRLNWLAKLWWKLLNSQGDDEQKFIASFHVNYQPLRMLEASGEYAMKAARVAGDGTSFTELLRGRLLWDINGKYDFNLHAGTLIQHDTGTFTLAYGPEVGRKIIRNIWVSAGYNFSGFFDRDFGEAHYWARGPYMKLRIKFDENTIRQLKDAVVKGAAKDPLTKGLL